MGSLNRYTYPRSSNKNIKIPTFLARVCREHSSNIHGIVLPSLSSSAKAKEISRWCPSAPSDDSAPVGQSGLIWPALCFFIAARVPSCVFEIDRTVKAESGANEVQKNQLNGRRRFFPRCIAWIMQVLTSVHQRSKQYSLARIVSREFYRH